MTVNISDHVDTDQLHNFERLVCGSFFVSNVLVTIFWLLYMHDDNLVYGHPIKYIH